MAGRKKHEPEKIAAALRLLRALPVKDTRKTTDEMLHMLKGGILEALDKGYDRLEIRNTISAAELVISATTFNDFLAVNLKDAISENGKELDQKRKTNKEKTPKEPKQTAQGTSMRRESPITAKRKRDASENENPETGKRETSTIGTRENTPARESEPEKMPSYYTPDLPDTEL